MQIDWNPVVHILDTLSEGTYSFFELSHIVRHYDRRAFTRGLLFLADRGLIELSIGQGPFVPIDKGEWQQRLQDAFGNETAEQSIMTNTAIDLSKDGREVLRLLQIGHP